MAYENDFLQCLALCTEGQCESRDSLLVLLPYQNPHGTVRVIKESCKAQLEAGETRDQSKIAVTECR